MARKNADPFDLDVRLMAVDDSGRGSGGKDEDDKGGKEGDQPGPDMQAATDITCMTCNVNCDTYSGCGGPGPDTESGRTCGDMCPTGDARCP